MSKSKEQAKARGASRAGQRRPQATRSKSRPQAGAKARSTSDAQAAAGKAGSRRVDERIRSVGGWRAETLAAIRRMIHEADPDIAEDCKWVKPSNPLGVPVWSHAGIVCTGEAYKQVVKLTFASGAALHDPRRLFNASLAGNTRRAIDIREGQLLDAKAFKSLIKAAVAHNLRSTQTPKSPPKTRAKDRTDARPAKPKTPRTDGKVVLLSGGNPRIAKADGDAPVQAYIAAMPGWKRELGERLDALIVRAVPKVRKAVKWNSPFYGIEGQGWFLSFHVFTHYVKVTFFRGTSLRPAPPGGTGKDARWIDIRQSDPRNDAQLAKWVKQAAALPGWGG